jgi:hypothetical protein
VVVSTSSMRIKQSMSDYREVTSSDPRRSVKQLSCQNGDWFLDCLTRKTGEFTKQITSLMG